MRSEQPLGGRVAVVTGGASGIGRASAVRLAADGADVLVADLRDGADTVAQIEQAGGRAYAVRVDTTSEAACEEMVAAAVARFGRVDIGVAAAGVATAAGPSNIQSRAADPTGGYVVNMQTDDFRTVVDVNLLGVLFTDRALAQQMLAQGSGGSLVNIASTAGRIPLAGAAPYCVSKAGVLMLTQVMGLELAPQGIRVNAVGPGYTETPMTQGLTEGTDAYEMAMSITPMGRLGRPEEVAATVAFLAGDEGSYFSGQVLHPAGGQFTG
jgi:NAD(P)-dependent dehydrogenase (short-subunit alcohol dehydrogenase family)